MSAPAAKAFTEPVRTTQRTLSSSATLSRKSPSSPVRVVFSAFSASGRFRVTTA
ncbi:hypothetical protein D3C78_1755450 [compost metagenome]